MRIVQLTDPHVVPPDRQPVHGVDTLERLRRTVGAVNRLEPQPAAVVVTGDLTHDETDESYHAIKSALAGLDGPCYLALGNHDDRSGFRRVMLDEAESHPGRYHYAKILGGHRLIVLDTQDEGEVPGVLDAAQLDWFERELAKGLPAIVCMHHPPVPVGVPWMDAMSLRENERFLQICERNETVRLILCGHVHHAFRVELSHATVLATPAVAMQFHTEREIRGNSSRIIVTNEPAAFRIVDLEGDGWKTKIHHLAD